MQLEAGRSCLVVVDMQSRMLAAMHARDAATTRARILLDGARELAVPAMATRQVPDKLGELAPELADALGEAAVFDKTAFPCTRAAGFTDALTAQARPQIVLAGIESHVCVTQSALALQAGGWEVAVCADACTSRHPDSHNLALARLRSTGVNVVTTEMVLFEWLGDAAAPSFKTISKLVK